MAAGDDRKDRRSGREGAVRLAPDAAEGRLSRPSSSRWGRRRSTRWARAGSRDRRAEPEPDPLVAKQTIDTLEMLREKTRGNLDDEERKLIESLLYELRMRFVEISEVSSEPGRPSAAASAPAATPAKINLGLRITGRPAGWLPPAREPLRADRSARRDRARDVLRAARRSSSRCASIAEDPIAADALADVADGPDNLVVRAARAFSGARRGSRASCGCGCASRIPAGAGLGGGRAMPRPYFGPAVPRCRGAGMRAGSDEWPRAGSRAGRRRALLSRPAARAGHRNRRAIEPVDRACRRSTWWWPIRAFPSPRRRSTALRSAAELVDAGGGRLYDAGDFTAAW